MHAPTKSMEKSECHAFSLLPLVQDSPMKSTLSQIQSHAYVPFGALLGQQTLATYKIFKAGDCDQSLQV